MDKKHFVKLYDGKKQNVLNDVTLTTAVATAPDTDNLSSISDTESEIY